MSGDRTPGGRRTILGAILGMVIPALLPAGGISASTFLPLTTGRKAWLSGGPVVAAEAVFPPRGFLSGREVARRYRRLLDPRGRFGGR